MKYILLIYENEKEWAGMSEGEQGSMFAEYGALSQSLKQSGNYLHGEPLEPTATATTVRVRNGRVQSTDGPFAETREQLGGFYLVDAKDLDEAIAIAGRMPAARLGSVEVRPILVMPGAPAAVGSGSAQATA